MSRTGQDVSTSLIEELAGLSASPSRRCIFKVDDQFLTVNRKAYLPEIVAIGPYNHNKGNLGRMEEYKKKYVKSLIKREVTKPKPKYKDINTFVETFVADLTALEHEIRASYAEPLSLSKDELIKMMVMDSCFIIELLKRFDDPNLREEDDRIFRMNWMLTSLQRDLILFENQLPFFVLCMLHDMIEGENHVQLVDHAVLFFNGILPGEGNRGLVSGDLKYNYIHLLDLVHDEWLPSFSKACLREDLKNTKGTEKWELIRCVTELQEAGIRIEKNEGTLFDIVFENKTLKIPPLTIEDRTDSILRNLIVHEQYDEYYPHFSFVSDYVKVLDCLIDSPKDVGILRQSGIIVNWKSDDEGVSTMFTDIYESVVGPSKRDFCYIGTFNQINKHCCQRRNRWMASLRKTYFSNPWAIISLFAAAALLILNLLQTIFTIMGYFKH
ncbi:hypothetical protein LguiA_002050 [Lonicera macranthoides]